MFFAQHGVKCVDLSLISQPMIFQSNEGGFASDPYWLNPAQWSYNLSILKEDYITILTHPSRPLPDQVWGTSDKTSSLLSRNTTTLTDCWKVRSITITFLTPCEHPTFLSKITIFIQFTMPINCIFTFLRLNCDKIMHYQSHWDFDALNSQTWRVSALDNYQIKARSHNSQVLSKNAVMKLFINDM